MAERMVTLERNTNETQIELSLDLDGTGRYEIDTGCGFLNHMLELFARHGRFDLVLTCHGDVQVDYHHTTEDVGIALGSACSKAADYRVDSRILFSAGLAAQRAEAHHGDACSDQQNLHNGFLRTKHSDHSLLFAMIPWRR